MSAIAARGVLRAATRRQASTLRDALRACEPHPYQRLPINQKPAPGAYGRMAKSAASRMVFFAPGIILIFGWPYLGMLALNGKVQ